MKMLVPGVIEILLPVQFSAASLPVLPWQGAGDAHGIDSERTQEAHEFLRARLG
jgi:hypothetical protein